MTCLFICEMYSGSVDSSIERDDYVQLPDFNLPNGADQLNISNELLERQYTDLTELMLMQHTDNFRKNIYKKGIS